jgi:Spy/CpxP family protein refolding chaperone
MYFKVALAALLFAVLSFTTLAQKSPGNTAPGKTQSGSILGAESPFWRMTPAMRIDRSLKVLQRDLKLTDSQVSRVRELVESRKTEFESIHAHAMPKFEELLSLLRQPNPDPAAVGKATIALKQVHEQAMAEQANLEKDFYNILTDSQRTTVDKLRNQAPAVLALHRLGLLAPEWMGHEQAFMFGG